jgi:hypothetical protein
MYKLYGTRHLYYMLDVGEDQGIYRGRRALKERHTVLRVQRVRAISTTQNLIV